MNLNDIFHKKGALSAWDKDRFREAAHAEDGGVLFAFADQAFEVIKNKKGLNPEERARLMTSAEQFFDSEVQKEAAKYLAQHPADKKLLSAQELAGADSEALIKQSLKNHKGIIFAMVDSSPEAHQFVKDKIELLKENRVEALATNYSKDEQKTFDYLHSIKDPATKLKMFDEYEAKKDAYNKQAGQLGLVNEGGNRAIVREALSQDMQILCSSAPASRLHRQAHEVAERQPGAVTEMAFELSQNIQRQCGERLTENGKVAVLNSRPLFDKNHGGYASEFLGFPSVTFLAADQKHFAGSVSNAKDHGVDYGLRLTDESGTLKKASERLLNSHPPHVAAKDPKDFSPVVDKSKDR